uniref:Phosphoserine phosphatase n=1 Tax=Brugia malayi TaxID=6279 RepID=A0A0I9R3D9_BRUMA|nr:Bm6954 [Brugia malayi]
MLEDEAADSLTENKEARAKKLWQMADAVCFDVDSTLCTCEMIDEFAKYLHCYEVVRFTEGTMNGEISFRESLKIRLSILKPTREQLEVLFKKKNQN